MSFLPNYTHIINPKLKHIYLSFNEVGELLIKSPKVSQTQIEKILLQKAKWISETRKKIIMKKGKPIRFTQGEEIYFLGESYPLQLIVHKNKYTRLEFDGDAFSLYYNHYDTKIFQQHLDAFYKKEAQSYVPAILDEWATRMQLKYNQVKFRKTKRQWGSCSARNNISFNTMIMKLPPSVIHYIIVHELAHIQHKHHQKDFWSLVEKYLPDYKIQMQALKNYTT